MADGMSNAGADYYQDDLVDFTRYGKLDAFELTDEELARLLEVWRWSVWNARHSPEDDVREAARRLQRRLAHAHNVEVEYNTALLLKQEIEPLLHLRALLDAPKALAYFLRHGVAFVRAIRQRRRLNRVTPVRDHQRRPGRLSASGARCAHVRPPDVLRRHYWHQLSFYSFEERKRLDYWW